MSKNLLSVLFVVAVYFTSIKAQVIVSEGFEGPLTGWTNQGSVVGTQGTVSPHTGGGMAALAVSNILTSSNFTLPSGDKHISFWINEFNNSPFGGYSISADLWQNGSSVKNLGTWKDFTKWTYVAADYLSAYSGNNFSVSFTVQSFIDPNVRFYIDDIKVAGGFSEVGIEESSINLSAVTINQDLIQNRIYIQTSLSDEAIDIEIYSIDGQKIICEAKENTMNPLVREVDLSNLSHGFYLVKVSSARGVFVEKVLF